MRRLPHQYPPDTWLFLTWHLQGAVPDRYPPPHKASAGQAFVWIDRWVDAAQSGPTYLAQREIAELVAASLVHGIQLGHYRLGVFAIMPNHVHALFLPRISPTRFMKSLKGYTAGEANRLLNRKGEHFWQKESYDHWVRNREEPGRIADYIEMNPVKAGLALTAESYEYSSAHVRWRPCVDTSVDAARTSACATH